jgi:hypothetical protein
LKLAPPLALDASVPGLGKAARLLLLNDVLTSLRSSARATVLLTGRGADERTDAVAGLSEWAVEGSNLRPWD